MKRILFLILTLCFYTGMAFSDITWSAPTAISTPLTNAAEPRVIIDGSGNATAIWVESNVIKASSLPFGGSWSAPSTLSNVLNTASTPRIGIDAGGNVTALWIENSVITTAVLPFGGSWSAAVSVSGSGATNPTLAVDGSGTSVAVWVRSGFVESSTRISGSWSLVAVLSTSNSDNPHVAISSFGTAIAVWHSVSAGSDLIVTDTLTLSTNTWAATKNVFNATAAFKHNYPKVAIDASGNATVAWFRYNLVNSNSYQNVQVLTSTLSVGSATWAIGTILSNSGIRNPADLTIKLRYDVSGNAFIVWTNAYDGETFSIESSQKLVGGSWLGFLLPQPNSLYSFGIDLALSSGTALLTNMAWDGVSTLLIQSQESDTTNPVIQGWTATNPFSTGNDNGYPSCAISTTSSTLNAVAVWINFDGSNTVINASTGSESVVTPPSNVLITQNSTNFGVYTDYYNTITWTASPEPSLLQYNIYRNGVFFGSTDPSTLQFIDHNQVQGGTVVYGVAALRSDFRQSVIVTQTFP